MRFKKTIAFAVSLAFLATSAMPLSVRNVFGTEIAMSVSADEAAEENKCGDNAVWTLEDGQLTISGSGAIEDFDTDNAPWDKTKVTSVVIGDGITAIGSHAFSGIVLEAVDIPATVISVGEYAFSECGAQINLTTIPMQIGNYAFAGDTINYGELEEFDYTLSDFIGAQNVTSSDEDIKDMDISLSRYDGKDGAEYGINAGDTLKINVDWHDYTPTGKIFYTTNVGYMLYMPDTYNYTEGKQKYFSANPYFITAGTAKSVNVNVYEVTGINTLTRICTKTFNLDSQANDETFKNSLEGISTVMFAGQTKTIAQILAESGIGHVNDCLTVSNVKAAEGENLTIDFLSGEITANEVGTAVVSYNASIADCLYHENASATGNRLTVYVAQMPEITATETSVTIADTEGYEFYLNGTLAGEKTSDGTVFAGLEKGRTYTVFMKTTDGVGQTNFTVSPSGHKLSVAADKSDKSITKFTCVNEDCVNSEDISEYFVKLAVTDDGGCEAKVEVQQSDEFDGIEISKLTYIDKNGTEVSEGELTADTYTAKSVVGDGENEVTIETEVTFGEHSFTDGICDNCQANETVIENKSFAAEYTFGDEITAPAAADFTTNGDADKMTFTWLDAEGNILEAAPVNAGSYKLLVSIPSHTYNDKAYTSANLALDVTVQKASQLTADDFTVTMPEDLTYSGEAKNVEVTANTEGLGEISVKYYNAEGNEAEPLNAGTYTFAVDVAQSENNEAITSITDESWTFEIEKLSTLSADDFTVVVPAEAVYDGEAKTATVTPLVEGIGEITVKYLDTNGDEVQPIAKGTYTVSIDVAEGVNNKAVTGVTDDNWVFFISKASAYVVTPPKAVEGLVYNGEEHTLIEAGEAVGGTLLYSTSKSGVYSEDLPTTVSGGTYTIWYYVKGDGVNYSDSEKLSVEVTVGKIPAQLLVAPQAIDPLVYTGSSLKLVTPGESETGTVMYSLTQGAGYSSKIPTAIQAGTYTVWYYVQGNSPNYSDTEIASVEVTISLAEAIVRSAPTPKTKLVYDGTAQALVASGKAKGGNMIYSLSEDGNYLMVIPTATNAGTYQVWYYVQSTDKNYVDSQKAYVEVTIAKVPNEITAAPTAIEGLVYNGEAQALITEGTAEYGTMMYALSENGEYSAEIPTVTNAGTYQVWYYGQGNENYADTEKAYVEVSIQKVNGSVEAPPTAIETLSYNGEAQALVSAGKTNTGTMMYSLSENGEYSSDIPTATNAGTYTVWYYSFGDVNHYDTEKASIEVTIQKASATVEVMPAAVTELLYNGEAQALITAGEAVNGTMLYALSEDGEYSSEIPTATNGGTYTVWYYVKGDENYADTKPASIEVTIEKLASVVNPVIKDKEYSEGDALPEISLSEGDTKGTVSWIVHDILLQVGENVLEWFFTPDDENYSTVTGTAVVNAKETTTTSTSATTSDTSSDTTESSVTTSDTTASSATTSDTTASSVTTSDTTESSATTSDTTVSSATTSDTTASSVTTSGTTVSSATTSDTTASSVTTSDTTVSSATTSDTTVSSATTSDTTVSSATTSDTTVSSATTSDTTASSVTTSKTTASSVTTSKTTVSSVTTSKTTASSVTTTEVTTVTTVETKVVYIGDANQDDKVNVRDAALIAYMLSIDYADALPFTSDFNQDSVINVRDAAAIARALASNEAKHWIQVIIKVYPKQ